MMDLRFPTIDLSDYKSRSQQIRVLSETWLAREMYCPVCGNKKLAHYENNRPVADFYCESCKQDFELKSKGSPVGRIIADGAYKTAIRRINSNSNPHLFVLNYHNSEVHSLVFIPKFFFVESIIQKRPPLAETAKRAGWEGCNIIYEDIPRIGKISIVTNKCERKPEEVFDAYRKAELLSVDKQEARGWLMDTLLCMEGIPDNTFSLDMMYAFESRLRELHPYNNNIRAKIRQQLQLLRDKGYIKFIGRGVYQKLGAAT